MEGNIRSTLTLDNREKLMLIGVKKLGSATPTAVFCETTDGGLKIVGRELRLDKYSVEDGTLTVVGKIDSLTFTNGSQKGGFVKRLFK